MRLTNPLAAIQSPTQRRLLAALLVLIVVGVLAELTVTRAFGLLSGTTTNSSNTYTASSCFQSVPVAMTSGPNRFVPASLTIAAGCTVIWTNATGNNHNSRSTSAPVVWSSASFQAPTTFSYQFNTPGTYPYRCSLHPGQMLGTITVT
jgi:plastocyanin